MGWDDVLKIGALAVIWMACIAVLVALKVWAGRC